MVSVMQSQTTYNAKDRGSIFVVREAPVMQVMMDVMEKLAGVEKLTLYAKGRAIPTAVAVANIITEKTMNGRSRVDRITVGSEDVLEMGRILSTIRIVLVRKA